MDDNSKRSKTPPAPTKSEYIHGSNLSPDDFDAKNKDNSITHVDKPKKTQ